MTDFLRTIFALIIIAGAAEFLVSDGGLKGFVRFACGLILILMLLGPLRALLSGEIPFIT